MNIWQPLSSPTALVYCHTCHGKKERQQKTKRGKVKDERGEMGVKGWAMWGEGLLVKEKREWEGEKILQRREEGGEISDKFRQYIKCRGSTSYFEISLIRGQLFFPHSHPQIYNPTCHLEKVRRYILLRLSGSLGSCSDL